MSHHLLPVVGLVGLLTATACSPTPPPVTSSSAPATQVTNTPTAGTGLIVLLDGGVFGFPDAASGVGTDLPGARWLAPTPSSVAVTLADAILLGRPQPGAATSWERLVPRWRSRRPAQPFAAAVADGAVGATGSGPAVTFALTTMDGETGAATVSLVARDGSARLLDSVGSVLWPAASWIDRSHVAVTVLHEGVPDRLCALLIDTVTGASADGPCGENLVLTGAAIALVASHTRDAARLVALESWLTVEHARPLASFAGRAMGEGSTLEAAALDGDGARLALGWWDGAAGNGTLAIYTRVAEGWRAAGTRSLQKRPLGLAWIP